MGSVLVPFVSVKLWSNCHRGFILHGRGEGEGGSAEGGKEAGREEGRAGVGVRPNVRSGFPSIRLGRSPFT